MSDPHDVAEVTQMADHEVVEKKTTVTEQPVVVGPGQTTNVNVHPDGGADVQVNDGGTNGGAVVEETTTTRRVV